MYPFYQSNTDIGISYSAVCGSGSYTELHGVISSPGYPLSYQNSMNCNYSIELNQPGNIALAFQSPFYLETNYDFVKIDASRCGCSQYYAFTGSLIPANVTFPRCTRLVIQFQTDVMVVEAGFRLIYDVTLSGNSTLPCPPGTPISTTTTQSTVTPTTVTPVSCGVVWFNGPQGVISSPRLPSTFDWINCFYVIELSQDSTINLSFLPPFRLNGSREDMLIDASGCGCPTYYRLYGSGSPGAMTFPYCRRIVIQYSNLNYNLGWFSISYNAYPVSGLTSDPTTQQSAYYELTRSKPARQSNTFNNHAASLALDGNPASSSVSAVDAQSSVIGRWQVDLGDIYRINKLILVNSDDFYEYQSLSNFFVTIALTDGTNFYGIITDNVQLCFYYANVTSPIARGGNISMNCSQQPTPGRYVTIRRLPGGFRPDMIALGEVYIFSDENLDLGHTKLATSKRFVYNADPQYSPSKAVDGYQSTCSVTVPFTYFGPADEFVWWQIDLGMVYDITSITIVNTDHPGVFSAYQNMTNFQVFVDYVNATIVNSTVPRKLCYDFPSDGAIAVTSGQSMSLKCRNSPLNGRYVTIVASNCADSCTIVLCEVYVYTALASTTPLSSSPSSSSQSPSSFLSSSQSSLSSQSPSSSPSSSLLSSLSSSPSSSPLSSSSLAISPLSSSTTTTTLLNPPTTTTTSSNIVDKEDPEHSMEDPVKYNRGDMIALGVVLGCVVFICGVVIVVLIILLRSRDRRFKIISAALTDALPVDGGPVSSVPAAPRGTDKHVANTFTGAAVKYSAAGEGTGSTTVDIAPLFLNRENLKVALDDSLI